MPKNLFIKSEDREAIHEIERGYFRSGATLATDTGKTFKVRARNSRTFEAPWEFIKIYVK